MQPDDRFRALVREELRAAGLIPSRDHYAGVRKEVSRRGAVERDRIVAIVGRARWRRSLATLGRPLAEEDCIRVLGFGGALAEFAIAPLALPREESESVSRLGALANLIVSMYDEWLDLGQDPEALLSRAALRQAAGGALRARTYRLLSLARPAPSTTLFRMVAEYFQALRGLRHTRERPAVHAFIHRVIVRMYDAESATVRPGSEVSRGKMLRRKGALPFVVLGAPGWLAAAELPRARVLSHLRWMYRLGEFVGWIDDVVDLREDAAAGRPNRVADALGAMGSCREAEADLARRLAATGGRILAEWHRSVAGTSPSRAGAAALPVCLASWLGGAYAAE